MQPQINEKKIDKEIVQQTIDEINKRGWHGIRGRYTGGNDEGGIDSMEGIILKEGVNPKTVFHAERDLSYAEIQLKNNNIAHTFPMANGDWLKRREEWDSFPLVDAFLSVWYETYAGNFECFGDYWVTRKGVYHYDGDEGEMKYEHVIIASNVGDAECLI